MEIVDLQGQTVLTARLKIQTISTIRYQKLAIKLLMQLIVKYGVVLIQNLFR